MAFSFWIKLNISKVSQFTPVDGMHCDVTRCAIYIANNVEYLGKEQSWKRCNTVNLIHLCNAMKKILDNISPHRYFKIIQVALYYFQVALYYWHTFSLKVCSVYFSGGGEVGDAGRRSVTTDFLAPFSDDLSAKTIGLRSWLKTMKRSKTVPAPLDTII